MAILDILSTPFITKEAAALVCMDPIPAPAACAFHAAG